MIGRGAWSTVGMPENGSQFYELLYPTPVGSQGYLGPDYAAVGFAVIAIKKRIIELGYTGPLHLNSIFGTGADAGLRWAQKKLGLSPDGQFGPKTSVAFFWPVCKHIAGVNAKTVGGLCAHESGWDPGAVGFTTPDDHGLVQINRPANPTVSLAQAFDPHFAFHYCANRISAALTTYHSLDVAICSYNSPQWAQEWSNLGHAPNATAQKYVDSVKAWNAPLS